MKNLTNLVVKQLKRKPILTICIIGASITRLISVLFCTYLILWINTFIKREAEKCPYAVCPLKDTKVAKDIYIQIMCGSALLSCVVLPIFGKLCDVFDPRKIISLAFLSRCVTTYLFYLLKEPQTFTAFIVCVSMVLTTIGE